MVRLQGEDPASLAAGDAAELRHDHLDDEASAWGEVRCGVGKYGQLVILGGDVHDGVARRVYLSDALGWLDRDVTGDETNTPARNDFGVGPCPNRSLRRRRSRSRDWRGVALGDSDGSGLT